ncbi:hypothetical protein BDF14DRAFT_1755700 [Spinellus fusiger]|nr:hypothetical protein BDF14DRAFT_1755700 [Spinellus fusiger]
MNSDPHKQTYLDWKSRVEGTLDHIQKLESDIAQVQHTIEEKKKRIALIKQHASHNSSILQRYRCYKSLFHKLQHKPTTTTGTNDVQDVRKSEAHAYLVCQKLERLLLDKSNHIGLNAFEAELDTVRSCIEQLHYQSSHHFLPALALLVQRWRQELIDDPIETEIPTSSTDIDNELAVQLKEERDKCIHRDEELQAVYSQYPTMKEKERHLLKSLNSRVSQLYTESQIRQAVIESICAKAESQQTVAELQSIQASVESIKEKAIETGKNDKDSTIQLQNTVDMMVNRKRKIHQLIQANIKGQETLSQQHKQLNEFIRKDRLSVMKSLKRVDHGLQGKISQRINKFMTLPFYQSHLFRLSLLWVIYIYKSRHYKNIP